MILRLSGADFSASNIGHIDIIKTLRPETITLLSNFTKTLTDSQKFAVQDFIDGLKDNGIWSCIGNLYLPILCGAVEETFYNIKTSTKDTTASGNYYELTTNGLASKDVTATTNIATVPLNASQQNLHMAVYNTEAYGTLSANEILFGNGANNQYIQLIVDTNKYITAKTDRNSNVSIYTNNCVKTTKSLKMLVQSTLGNMLVENTNSKYEFVGTPIATDNTYTNFPLGVLGLKSITGRASTVHYGMISLGTAMDGTKAKKYSELCDAFMNSFI